MVSEVHAISFERVDIEVGRPVECSPLEISLVFDEQGPGSVHLFDKSNVPAGPCRAREPLDGRGRLRIGEDVLEDPDTVDHVKCIFGKWRRIVGEESKRGVPGSQAGRKPACRPHHIRRRIDPDDAVHLRGKPERPPTVPAPEIENDEIFPERKDAGVERLLCGINVMVVGIVPPYDRPQGVAVVPESIPWVL